MTREDLKQYKYAQKWIKNQLEKYEEQRTLVYNISQNLDGMPRAQNKPNYSVENLLDKYDELIQILKKDQERQNEIILQIRKIKEPYRTILTDKYILNMSLEEVAVDINYAYNRTCTMHGDALDMFDELNKKLNRLKNVKIC